MSTFRRARIVLREASALLTQARYLGLDWSPQMETGRGPHVVLLHGLYASAGVFRPIRRAIQEQGAGISSFSYLPGPGILELAEKMRVLVSNLPHQGPVFLVGHSLGGLVARHYARSPACDLRVVQTISLAAPFYGSYRHSLVPGQAGRDLVPDAAILEPLTWDDAQNRQVPHLSLAATDDQLVRGQAFPRYGEVESFAGVGHNGILFDTRAISAVVLKIQVRLAGLHQA